MDDFTSQTTSLVQNPLFRGAQGSNTEVCMSPVRIEEQKQPLTVIAHKSSIRLPSYAGDGDGEAPTSKSHIKVSLITVKACKKIQSSRHLNTQPLSSNQLHHSHAAAHKREQYVEIELSDSNDSLESLEEEDSKAAEAASPIV